MARVKACILAVAARESILYRLGCLSRTIADMTPDHFTRFPTYRLPDPLFMTISIDE
jgi:hypothetical protein